MSDHENIDEAAWLRCLSDLDRFTAEMERLIVAGTVTDPIVIAMVRQTRATLEEFFSRRGVSS